ncbi:MAG: MFS transporter [Candidatus Bathyarchaeia archaeon]
MRQMLILRSNRRIKVVMLTNFLYNFVMQVTSYYTVLLAQALGANGFDIGLIHCISSFAVLTTTAHVGLAVERCSIKKLMIIGIICEIAAMAIFISAPDWRWLIIAVALQGQIIRVPPLIDIIFITFANFQERATLIGLSHILWGINGIFAPITAAMIVTYCGGINSQGIRPLFYIALVILLTLLFILLYALEETYIASNIKESNKPEKKGIVKEYSGFFKNEKYAKHWTALRFFRDGFISLLYIYTPLWIVNVKGASPTVLGMFSSISAMSAMLMRVPVSILSNKLGRKKTFFLCSIFYCLGIIVLIFAPNFNFLILASILGTGYGGIGGASFTPLITMWWEAVPANERGKLYGIEGTIYAGSKFITSIIGGMLWVQGFMEFALLSPVLIELIVVIPLLYSIPETLEYKSSATLTGELR